MKQIITDSETGARLKVFSEPSAVRPMIVICPGGGYRLLSPREGEPVARAFQAEGFGTAILEYEVGGEGLMYRPMRGLAWAVRHIREHAGTYGADPRQIFVCGFSAGGHVAGLLGASWDNVQVFSDPMEGRASRPDGLILCYPVVTAGKWRHEGSFQRLCADPARWEGFSVETLVGPGMPPVFLWHTAEDDMVPVQNSLLLANALAAQGISWELHVFPRGVHGLSLATREVDEPEKGRLADPRVAQWLLLAAQWVRERCGQEERQYLKSL